MDAEQVGRRLTTILAADVARYARLMRADARLQSLAYPGGICVSSAVRSRLSADMGGRDHRRLIRSYPDVPNAYRWIAASLGQLGRTGEATPALAAAITVSAIRSRCPGCAPQDHAHMLEGLRQAAGTNRPAGAGRRDPVTRAREIPRDLA
jgi:hypothetical protein